MCNMTYIYNCKYTDIIPLNVVYHNCITLYRDCFNKWMVGMLKKIRERRIKCARLWAKPLRKIHALENLYIYQPIYTDTHIYTSQVKHIEDIELKKRKKMTWNIVK